MSHPQPERTEESPRALFEKSLPEIDRIIGSATRRMALRPDEAGDFKSWVHLKMIEDDYGVLRKFAGRSTLATYLTVVVQNLARDYRTKKWGRWRPSAAAERMGVAAVQLEILLERDGFTLDEAIEGLRENHGVRMSSAEIIKLAAQLPVRVKAKVEGGEVVESVVGSRPADESLKEREQGMTLSRAQDVLNRALAGLDVTDRLILRMHYESGLRISAIARALGLKQRKAYTRRDRCLRELNGALLSAGLEGEDVMDALGWQKADFRVEFNREMPGDADTDPSNVMKPRAEDPHDR